MSLVFDELGLASADIQFVIPDCSYSKVREEDARDGTSRVSASQSGRQGRLVQDLLFASGEKLSVLCGFMFIGGAMF